MKEQPEKKWFRYDTFSLSTPAVCTSSVPVHLPQDKENKLNFGFRERTVIVVMNEAGVPLAQTSASLRTALGAAQKGAS